ncbi:hypothetical protein CHLRE_15g636800v5 [Chlamydomonas reinhardtii]|uniref:Glutathione S-transferase n=1 Tax=Chlamydomonas reinhardtii TaxID=3055 RepID=A0A2K3CWI8_CHLRE|nr:uncharacterized protein CHLRE_15g636800v5 [Chlamydomonas reinhardtii]PNW72644.1 hypothetical protein CHLRE_15g636800v5 [Chlamydomonas reinhardtii]
MKLYTNPASRGCFVEWYVSEIGKESEVEVVNLDMGDKREHKSDWYKKINPFGKLPALEDGDLKLFESGAIILYIAEKYGQFKSPAERARAQQWALFANSTLTQAVFVEEWRDRFMPDMMTALDALLGASPGAHIDGPEFGISDVLVGGYLLYIPAYLPQVDLSPYPHVQAYMKRLAERPHCAATVVASASGKRTAAAAAAATAAAATQ